MKQVFIPGTSLRTSKFIFGTASLFNVGSSGRREKLLEAAVDHGFTHFDTAPYYGFGLAEKDLAPVLRRNPQVTVTTKVGLYSPGGEQQSAVAVFFRKAGGRLLPVLSAPKVDFQVARARKALEASLVRLGRDTIDFYMLHEPELDLLDTDEMQRWLEASVTSGKIRAFGLAVTADRLKPFLQTRSSLAEMVQVADSLEHREADLLAAHNRPVQITYGYISAARSQGSTMPVSEILGKAIERNRDGAIIVSTKRPQRLAQYAILAEQTR